MKDHEWGAVIVAFLVGVGLTASIILWAGWFSGNEYANGASNALSLITAPGLIVAIGFGAWRRWHGRCAFPGCVRTGEHEVDGTIRKVCGVHHDQACHDRCRTMFPHQFGWRR